VDSLGGMPYTPKQSLLHTTDVWTVYVSTDFSGSHVCRRQSTRNAVDSKTKSMAEY